MKGEIFNLLEKFVSQSFGRKIFEDIYNEAKPKLETKEPFVGPGTYPDSDFLTILGVAVNKLNIPLPTAVKTFGKFSLPILMSKVPEKFITPTAKSFLMSIDSIIHVEVKKMYKGANPPKFTYQDPAPDKLIMIYRSKRKMYDLVEGFIDGLAQYYKTNISYERKIITINGEEACEFFITFH